MDEAKSSPARSWQGDLGVQLGTSRQVGINSHTGQKFLPDQRSSAGIQRRGGAIVTMEGRGNGRVFTESGFGN